MKYGESAFDILYLILAIVTGMLILRGAQGKTERRMGIAVLLLGCGDAFHLVPRVLNYFVDADFTAALGLGKLVTSITMTVFYVLVYEIGCDIYNKRGPKDIRLAVCVLAAIRVIVCLLPQNGWLRNECSMTWGILRNIPFVLLGALVICLYYRNRNRFEPFRSTWLWMLLSFAFYIPVAVGAGAVPMLGMLMLPKTICYLVIIYQFFQAAVVRSDLSD